MSLNLWMRIAWWCIPFSISIIGNIGTEVKIKTVNSLMRIFLNFESYRCGSFRKD